MRLKNPCDLSCKFNLYYAQLQNKHYKHLKYNILTLLYIYYIYDKTYDIVYLFQLIKFNLCTIFCFIK